MDKVEEAFGRYNSYLVTGECSLPQALVAGFHLRISRKDGRLRIVRISLMVLALLAFVLGQEPTVHAKSGERDQVHKRKKKAAKKRRAAKKKKAARKRRKAKRNAPKKSGRKPNMPPGWSWPPNADMLAKGDECLIKLGALGVSWKHAKARNFITTPIVVPSMELAGLLLEPTFRKGPFVMDCHLALAIAKMAEPLRAANVRALRFSSIHAVRTVRVGGKRKKSLSRHALGLAIDVYELSPIDGEVVIVKKHYYSQDLPKKVEQITNESEGFRLVLSPANDPKSHYDHLHLEASVGDKKRIVARRTPQNRKQARRRQKARDQRRARKRKGRKARKRRREKRRKRQD